MSDLTQKIKFENNKLLKKLRQKVGKAINDFNMIEPGDRVMVCLSGGKDSYGLLDILLGLQRSAPIEFELVAVNLDQKQPLFPAEVLPDYLKSLGIEFHIIEEDTYRIVKEKITGNKTACSLCSRLRRGILYRVATEIRATKIALGHHRDDIVETLFLNLFYGGQLKAMPAKLLSDDGKHVVIRPLAYVAEKDLVRLAALKKFPIIPCNLCGSQPNLQRKAMKEMLLAWERQHPGRTETIFSSLQHIVPSHLLDIKQFNFSNLGTTKASNSPSAWQQEDSCSAPLQPVFNILASKLQD
ncbi:MAG: tRNA 2-thiocytidine(32) synthetase TtcA [Neisseriaceae bacterium]